MFRAIYNSASAVVKMKGVDGKVSYSESFPIRRGVLYGDTGITSPVYFILTIDEILHRHDKHGIPFWGKVIHTLRYTDNTTLLTPHQM